jgi:hypothetical protein
MRSPRRLTIVIAARLAAGTLLLPLTLAAGLLSIPSTCQCGADMPHSHALLAIGEHQHARGHQQADSPQHRREVVASGQNGVTVQAPSGPSLSALAAIDAERIAPAGLPRAVADAVPDAPPFGRTAAPDVPPPQS